MKNKDFILKLILVIEKKVCLIICKYYMMDQHFHNSFLNFECYPAHALVAEIGKYMLNNLR